MKRLCLLLTLALTVLLCACAPDALPSAPTTPPTQNGEEPADLTKLGTICDIAQTDDGLLLLTHKGLYKRSADGMRLESAGEAYDRLFASDDNGEIFSRLRLEPDAEPGVFSQLRVTSQGVFFYCSANQTVYRNGEVYLSAQKIASYDAFARIEEYNGAIYVLVRDDACQALYRDGVLVPTAVRPYDLAWSGGELCLSSMESGERGLYPIGADGRPDTERKQPFWGLYDLCARSGDWFYYVNPFYGFQRSNGETVEFLSCPELVSEQRHPRALIVTSLTEGIMLSDEGAIETVHFEPTRSFARCTMTILTDRKHAPELERWVEHYSLFASGVEVLLDVRDTPSQVMGSAEKADLIYLGDYALLSQLALTNRLTPLDKYAPELTVKGVCSEPMAQLMRIDGTAYFTAPYCRAVSAMGAPGATLIANPTLDDLFDLLEADGERSTRSSDRLTELREILQLHIGLWVDFDTLQCDFSGKEFRAVLDYAMNFPTEYDPEAAAYDPKKPTEQRISRWVEKSAVWDMLTRVSPFWRQEELGSRRAPYCFALGGHSGYAVEPAGYFALSAGSRCSEAAAVFLNYLMTSEALARSMDRVAAGSATPMYRPLAEKLMREHAEKLSGSWKSYGEWAKPVEETLFATLQRMTTAQDYVLYGADDLIDVILQTAADYLNEARQENGELLVGSAEEAAGYIQHAVQEYLNRR